MADEARILDCATVEDYLARAFDMRRALGIPEGAALRVRPIARGEYNVNYAFCHPVTGKHLLFRINLGSQMHLACQIEYEAHALELLAASGRTPRVLYVDGSGSYYGKGVLIEEMLPGRPLDYATDLEEAARILADIHAVEVVSDCGLVRPMNPIGALVEECRSMFDVYRAWPDASEAIISSMGKLFAHVEAHRTHCGAPVRLHIVSTELNSGNFLINEGGRSFLIDWEKPLAAEAEQDLAHFLAPTTTFWKTDTLLDRTSMDRFLACYCNAVGNRFDTTGVRKRVNDYMAATCLRGLTWCAMAYAQHESGVRCVADEYTLGKVKAYLTEEFFETIWRVCTEQ